MGLPRETMAVVHPAAPSKHHHPEAGLGLILTLRPDPHSPHGLCRRVMATAVCWPSALRPRKSAGLRPLPSCLLPNRSGIGMGYNLRPDPPNHPKARETEQMETGESSKPHPFRRQHSNQVVVVVSLHIRDSSSALPPVAVHDLGKSLRVLLP